MQINKANFKKYIIVQCLCVKNFKKNTFFQKLTIMVTISSFPGTCLKIKLYTNRDKSPYLYQSRRKKKCEKVKMFLLQQND